MISSAEMVWLVETKRLPTGKSSNARFTRKHCRIAGEGARCKLRLTRQHDRPGIDGGGHCPVPEKLERRRNSDRLVRARRARASDWTADYADITDWESTEKENKEAPWPFSSALSAKSAVQRNDPLRESFNR